eukprot:11258105-Prorocentrum_lima.AAC.1
MTSSLVGSEMCIRDSSFSPAFPSPRMRLALASQLTSRDIPPLEIIYTVSYTHLTLPTICSV